MVRPGRSCAGRLSLQAPEVRWAARSLPGCTQRDRVIATGRAPLDDGTTSAVRGCRWARLGKPRSAGTLGGAPAFVKQFAAGPTLN